MTEVAEREFVTLEQVKQSEHRDGVEKVRGDELRPGDHIWTEKSPWWNHIAGFGQQGAPGWINLVFEDKSGMVVQASERYWSFHHLPQSRTPFVTDTVDVTFEDGQPGELVVRIRNTAPWVAADDESEKVWVLRSKTYLPDSEVVGLFQTRLAAERWAADATPPVGDAVIEEWAVRDDRRA